MIHSLPQGKWRAGWPLGAGRFPPALLRPWTVDAFVQLRLLSSLVAVNQAPDAPAVSPRWFLLADSLCVQLQPLWSISVSVPRNAVLSAGLSAGCSSGVERPCWSCEHGGKPSGLRLPGGRGHRRAFRRRPGAYRHVVCLITGFFPSSFAGFCARVSGARWWRWSLCTDKHSIRCGFRVRTLKTAQLEEQNLVRRAQTGTCTWIIVDARLQIWAGFNVRTRILGTVIVEMRRRVD